MWFAALIQLHTISEQSFYKFNAVLGKVISVNFLKFDYKVFVIKKLAENLN